MARSKEVAHRANERAKQFYAQNRSRALAYLGGECTTCGSTQRLEFDHVVPADKEYEIVYLLHCRWERLVRELDKCQLLCRQCHIDKSRRDADVGHGGGAIGKTGCKCEPCRQRVSEYTKARRRKKRAEELATGILPKRPVTVPHGGGTQGKRGCKCEPCSAKRREYHQARYRKTHPNPTTEQEKAT